VTTHISSDDIRGGIKFVHQYVTPRVVAAWDRADFSTVAVLDDGSVWKRPTFTGGGNLPLPWKCIAPPIPTPPVAEPVEVADAKADDALPAFAHLIPWVCRQCAGTYNGRDDLYRNLPSATRCGRCGSSRP
jgi:hypothetical protein